MPLISKTKVSDAANYGAVSVIFHWLTVLLLAVQYFVGLMMPHVGWGTRDAGLISWHLSFGAAILLLMSLRLLWRLLIGVPKGPAQPIWANYLSRLVHCALYVVVLSMTVLGWASASARGWDVRLFGTIALPALVAKGTRWGFEAGDVHSVLAYALLILIVVHVLGAIYHVVVLRDRSLNGMLGVRITDKRLKRE